MNFDDFFKQIIERKIFNNFFNNQISRICVIYANYKHT